LQQDAKAAKGILYAFWEEFRPCRPRTDLSRR